MCLAEKGLTLQRGLRERCPLSPVLFNIFINDILDGAAVPRIDRRVPGLLFADDLVATTGSRKNLEHITRHLENWMTENDMRVGIHKCGAMRVGIHGGSQNALELEPERWAIHGDNIPIIESYQYLGITFRADLDLHQMVADRLEKGRKLVAALHPFLRSMTVPMHMRMVVVRAVLLPTLLYGAEVKEK